MDVVDQSATGNLPLLYAEVVGGTVFGTMPTDIAPFDGKQISNAFREYWKRRKNRVNSQFQGVNVAGNPGAVEVVTNLHELMAVNEAGIDTTQPKPDFIRQGTAKLKIIPKVYEKLKQKGLITIKGLYLAIQRDAEKNGAEFNLDYRTMYMIACGKISPWSETDKNSSALPEALALARTLELNVLETFGSMEAFKERMRRTPISSRIIPEIKAAMRETGIGTAKELHEAVNITVPVGLALLHSLISGTICPYKRVCDEISNGREGKKRVTSKPYFKEVANEIATVLNKLPEELFGPDPLIAAVDSFDNSYGKPSPIAIAMHYGSYNDAKSPLEKLHQEQALKLARRIPRLIATSSRNAEILEARLCLNDPYALGVDGRPSNETLGKTAERYNISNSRVQELVDRSLRNVNFRVNLAAILHHCLTPLDLSADGISPERVNRARSVIKGSIEIDMSEPS